LSSNLVLTLSSFDGGSANNLSFMIRVFFVFILLPSISLTAQQEFTYYDRNENLVPKEDCHHYYLKKASYNEVDSLVSYYCQTNLPRSIRHVDSNGIATGLYRFYYENGNLKTQAMYNGREPFDSLYEWYPAGSLHYLEYRGTKDKKDRKLISYIDSSGIVQVKNGMGFCSSCSFQAFYDSGYTESGPINSGLKHSIWTTYDAVGLKTNEEKYEFGQFISGTHFGPDGRNVPYTLIDEAPIFHGGIGAFYQFVNKNIRYPKDARKQKISGMAYVGFVVEKDGTISEVKCLKKLGGGLDEEAERVVALSPKWKPGRQKGQIVRRNIVMTINFHL
jgi:TonB family protein